MDVCENWMSTGSMLAIEKSGSSDFGLPFSM